MRFLAVILLTLATFAVSAQTPAKGSAEAIEVTVESLLLKKDLTKLSAELASKKSTTTEELLVKLSVFGRAGHRVRVYSTLRELAKSFSAEANQSAILKVIQNAVDADDLDGLRLIYENFARNGDQRSGQFVSLWLQNGDPAELEKWLKTRFDRAEWWNLWTYVKKARGAGAEVAEELEREIRRNPADFELVRRYLVYVNNNVPLSVVEISPIKSNVVSFSRDVSWLADVVGESAYAAFELGVWLQTPHPETSIGLLKKSLSLEFTEKDLPILRERSVLRSPRPLVSKNPEKQLRVWTKSALVELYRRTNRTELAQPIVEELTLMDLSDVQTNGPFYEAGAVQASTGMRVIESRILQNESVGENSAGYWLDRIAYYRGRREDAAVWQSFTQALAKLPYVPNDSRASNGRFLILHQLYFFDEEDDPQAAEFLRGDLIRARDAGDLAYLYNLLQIIRNNYGSLVDEFFVNTDFLPKTLATVPKWSYYEQYAIESVMEREKWDASKRNVTWDTLATLALNDVPGRAYRAAETMVEAEQYQLALRLLNETLKIAPAEAYGSFSFDRGDVQDSIFEVYLATGNWQKGEQAWRAGFRVYDPLGRLALAAAEEGNVRDAVRFWKLNANLDRRNLQALPKLAKTNAAAPLREFYGQMKANDPLSNLAEPALALLN